MKVRTGDTTIKFSENLIEDESQVVTHLVLGKGREIPVHQVKYSVIVVPIKGKVLFLGSGKEEIIYPGKIVQLAPNESHSLKALETSELMVIKSMLV